MQREVAKVEGRGEDKRGGSNGPDNDGRGPRCPCHSNLLHTVYLEKLHRAPKIEGAFSLLPGQRKEGGTEGG